jgi:hypothetical protein
MQRGERISTDKNNRALHDPIGESVRSTFENLSRFDCGQWLLESLQQIVSFDHLETP